MPGRTSKQVDRWGPREEDGGHRGLRVSDEVRRISSGAPEQPGPEAFTATHPKRTERRFDFPELRQWPVQPEGGGDRL
jgi:hypothetical protein